MRSYAPTMVSGQPSIGRQSGRMIYVTRQLETKIFKLALGACGAGEPKPLIETEGDQRDLGVAPDGARIAFVSNRTGSKEIWIANSDGSNQTQLTFFNGPSVGSPRWSPEGKSIAFDGYAGGSSDIYVMPVEGGKPVRLTSDAANEVRPSWSRRAMDLFRLGPERRVGDLEDPSVGGTGCAGYASRGRSRLRDV